MNPTLRSRIRQFLPAPLVRLLTRHRRVRFTGPYAAWAEADARSSGYDAPAILERVAAATRAVVAGRAAFERDSITFAEPAPDRRLVELLNGLPVAGGPLRVLDFGGALGSSYHQHRAFLTAPTGVVWNIVEQEHYVARGRAEFQTGELRFHRTIAAAGADGPPQVVLLASVLQYLPAPWKVLAEAADLPAAAWIVTRTPFHGGAADLPVVQHVPATIYPASYPAWLLAELTFARFWRERDAVVSWHESPEGRDRCGRLEFAFRDAVIRPRGSGDGLK